MYIKARFSFVYLFVGNCKLKITTQIARDSPTCAGNTQVPAASRTRRKAMTVRKTIHQPFLGIVVHWKSPTPTSLEPEPHNLHPPRNFRETTRYTTRLCHFVEQFWLTVLQVFYVVNGIPPPDRPRGSRGSMFVRGSPKSGYGWEPSGSTHRTVCTWGKLRDCHTTNVQLQLFL